MNTPEGHKKQTATLLAKDPDYFKKLGSRGGKKKVPKGFAKMDKDKLKEVARKGGWNAQNPDRPSRQSI